MPNAANPFYMDPFGAPEAEMYEPVTKEQARKNRKAFARGVSYLPQDLVGAPVDLINLGLMAPDALFGTKLSSKKPVGGSDWLIEQSRRLAPNIVPEPTGEGWELGGRIFSGLFNPAGVVRTAVKTPAALAKAAEAGSLAATKKITGNPNLTMNDIYRAMGEQQMPVSGIIKEKGGNWLGKEEFAYGLEQKKSKAHLQDLWEQNVDEAQRMERVRLEHQLDVDKGVFTLREQFYGLHRGDIEPSKAYIDKAEALVPTVSKEDRLKLALELEVRALNKQINDLENQTWQESHDIISAKYGLPTVDELDQPRQIHNQWIRKPVTKYVTNLMGTADDPLRKLADEGIDRWINPNMLNEGPNKFIGAARAAQGYPAEGLGKTPLSRLFEEDVDLYLNDNILKPKDIRDPGHASNDLYQRNPWIGNLPENTPLYMLDENPPEFLTRLSREFKKMTQEGKIKPDQVSKWTPDSIARSAHERALADEALANKDMGAMKKWARSRKDTIPKAYEWNDGDSIAVLSNDIAPDTLKRDLSLQTCLLNHCVGSAGMDAGKYIPMVMPHTGKAPPKAIEDGHGAGYYDRILDGDIEVHSLLDRDGLPHVTMEWRVDFNDGEYKSYTISQIYGEENSAIKPWQREKIIDYLNERKVDIIDLDPEVKINNGIEEVTQEAITDALEGWIKDHSSKGIPKEQQISEMAKHYSTGFSGDELDSLSHSIADDFWTGDYPRFYSEDENLIEKHINKLFKDWWKENKTRYIESNV